MESAQDQLKELQRQLRLARFRPRKIEMDKLRRENLQLSNQNQKLLEEMELYKQAYESLLLKTK